MRSKTGYWACIAMAFVAMASGQDFSAYLVGALLFLYFMRRD